jgi:hypothetical protein
MHCTHLSVERDAAYSVVGGRSSIDFSRSERPSSSRFLPHDGRSRLDGSLPTLHSTRLRELGAALQAMSLVVSADCGVMHLASAAGARTPGLFKATPLAKYAPYGNGSVGMQASD